MPIKMHDVHLHVNKENADCAFALGQAMSQHPGMNLARIRKQHGLTQAQ